MVSVLFKLLSIIDHLLINICMTKPPQHYEVTFLEEWEKKLTTMNKFSLSFQNFNQVEILHIHKTN